MANFNDMQMIFIDKNAENRSTHWWDRFILAQWSSGDKFTLALKKRISYK